MSKCCPAAPASESTTSAGRSNHWLAWLGELNCSYNKITAGFAWCLYSSFSCRAPFLIFGFWACLPKDLLVYLHCESLPSLWKAGMWCCPVVFSELGNGVAPHWATPAAAGSQLPDAFLMEMVTKLLHLTCQIAHMASVYIYISCPKAWCGLDCCHTNLQDEIVRSWARLKAGDMLSVSPLT